MPKLTGFPRTPIPGPPPFPLLGHLPRVFQFMSDPIAALDRLRPMGDVVAVSRNNPAFVCAFGPERNREVLSNPEVFRHDEGFIDGPEGSSMARMNQPIIAINGDLHKRHRRLMAPAFTKAALDGYAERTVAIAEGMVAKWPRGEVIDLAEGLRDIALCVAVRTLFGLDMERDASDVGATAAAWALWLAHPLSIMMPYDLPGTPFRRALRTGDAVLATIERLITDKRASSHAHDDALGRLLQAADEQTGERLTDPELLSETITLFFAGYETTAKSLAWAMFLLERHPAILHDVLDELDAVLGDRPITVEDLPRLPLLDRVLKESMRLLTTVPILFLRVPPTEHALGPITLPRAPT